MQKQRSYPVKLNIIIALWLSLSGLLAACSGDTTGPAPTLPETSRAAALSPEVTAEALPATTTTVQPATGPGSGALPYDCAKVFCYGLAQEPVGLLQTRFDPANLVDRPSLQITRQLYETLFEFKPGDMQYQNSLLLKYPPQQSEDGLTFTFRIGKGLRFSDDTPADAAAVKFNFDRWSDPGNLYHKGDFQTWGYYFGGFPGNLDYVKADLPNSTVTLKLRRPMGSLYQILAMPQFAIVAPSAFNRTNGELERSTGSNMYALDKMVRTETKYITLRENKLYHVERYPPGDPTAPYVKSPVIVALVLKQNQDGLEELRKGTIDATDKLRPEQVPAAQQDRAFRLLERNPLDVAFLGFNHTRAPFNNLAVREAFAAAVDTRSLVRDYYFGLGQPATVLLPPTTLAYIDSHPPYTYDPERARRLLDNAGYNQVNPLRLDFWVLPVPRTYYPDPKKIANAIAADLLKVGVQLRVRDDYAWPQFRKERINASMDLYMFGWEGRNGDPDEFLGELYGKARGEGGYENMILQTLLLKGNSVTDLLNRRAFYKEAQDIIYEQALVLPLAYMKGLVALRPNVTGYTAHPTGIESWSTVEVKSVK